MGLTSLLELGREGLWAATAHAEGRLDGLASTHSGPQQILLGWMSQEGIDDMMACVQSHRRESAVKASRDACAELTAQGRAWSATLNRVRAQDMLHVAESMTLTCHAL